MGMDHSWHFYDGLVESQNPGKGDTAITAEAVGKKLGMESLVGHIVLVRVSKDN